MSTIEERLTKLRELKRAAEASQKQADADKADHAQYQEDLFAAMREAGVRSVKTNDAQFSARSTIYGSVQDIDLFMTWCKQHNVSADYFTDKPSMRRINELVRDRLDAGDEIPPGVGWFPRDYISITEN